jgi:hypothetical protein
VKEWVEGTKEMLRLSCVVGVVGTLGGVFITELRNVADVLRKDETTRMMN